MSGERMAERMTGQSVRVQVPNVGTVTGFLRRESAEYLAEMLPTPEPSEVAETTAGEREEEALAKALFDAAFPGERESDPYWFKAYEVDWRENARAVLASPWLAAHVSAAETKARAEVVWQVSAFGRGRSVDRVCDSLTTGQSVCDDLMEQLGGEWVVVEDWANLNVTEAPERWTRYVSRNGGAAVEQVVAEVKVDTSGTWFRDRAASIARGDAR